MLTTNKPLQKHYGNERTAADNLKRPLLPIITQWVKTVLYASATYTRVYTVVYIPSKTVMEEIFLN